eukprot:1927587-Amphidinium_carterae.1
MLVVENVGTTDVVGKSLDGRLSSYPVCAALVWCKRHLGAQFLACTEQHRTAVIPHDDQRKHTAILIMNLQNRTTFSVRVTDKKRHSAYVSVKVQLLQQK